MNKFLSLLKVNFLGLVRGKNSKKGKKTKTIYHFLLLVLIYGLVGYYSFKFAKLTMKGLVLINAQNILLQMYFAIISIFLIFSNYKKIDSLFFKSKDYDILHSMPIKNSYIVLSKILEVYVNSLLLTLATMIPAYVIYVQNASVGLTFNIFYFISLPLVPIIPSILSIAIGYLISYVSSFFKRKQAVQFILSIGLVLLIMYISDKFNTMDVNQFASMSKLITNVFNKFYPLTHMYKDIVVSFDINSLVVFIFINIVLISLATFIITRTYGYINGKLNQEFHSKNTKIKNIKSAGKIKTLLKKDFQRLFSSVNYILNSCIGVLMLVGVASVMFTSNSLSTELIKFLSEGKGIFAFRFITILFLGFIYPVAVSLSLEGKNFYILRTLPINFKNIIHEKVLFQLILSVIPIILSAVVCYFKLDYDFITILIVLALYTLASVFYSLVHLLIDITFIKLNWTNEIKIIKQSIQSILAVVVAILTSFIALSNITTNVMFYIYIGIIFVLTILSYIALITFGSKKYEKTCN